MAKMKIALLGATGETGTSILEGLAADGSFDITTLVRPSSAGKPSVQQLADRGFSVLTAGTGAGGARFTIRDVVGEAFLPAAEWASFEHAACSLTGTFVHEESQSNMTLSVDKEGAGLVIDSFFLNGTDHQWLLASMSAPAEVPGVQRVFPMGVNSEPGSLAALYDPKFTGVIAHRVLTYARPSVPRAGVESGQGGLFDNQLAWMNTDYLGPIDQLLFGFKDGKMDKISYSSQVLLTRV